MMVYLKKAGFLVADIVEREPYPDVEHQSRRAYIFAEKRRQRRSPLKKMMFRRQSR